MIDPYADDCLDQLLAMVTASPHPSHLLIDGVFLPSMPSVLKRWPAPVSNAYALFNERAHGDAETLAASPWLLPCSGHDAAVCQLLATCDPLPAVTLIRSPSDVGSLLTRLKRWTVVNCGGMHFNFRYPDTRRLPGIHRVLTDVQRHTLFGNDAWSYIGRDGHWHHLPPNSGSVTACDKAAQDWGDPALNDVQFADLLADSEPDEQLAAVWQDLPDDAPARTTALPSQAHAWITTALGHATRLKIDDMAERTRLCAWVLSGDPHARLAWLTQQTRWPTDEPIDNLLQEGV